MWNEGKVTRLCLGELSFMKYTSFMPWDEIYLRMVAVEKTVKAGGIDGQKN